jgi:ferredoxin
MKKRLGQKGWKVFYERQFYMPANIATPYRDAVVKQLHDAAMKKAGIMAVELCNRKERLRNDRIFPYFLFWLRFIEKLSWKTVPLDFYVKKSCTSCGLCVSLCPRRNIKLKANGIRFGLNCLACYRCVYRCPNRAISGRLYGFAIFKKGYDIRRIVDSEEIRGEFINENTKGYYRIFLRYLTGED